MEAMNRPPGMDAMSNPASTALVNVARNANSQRGAYPVISY